MLGKRKEYNTVVVNLLAALGRNLDKGVNEKMGFAGANTGNLMFSEAMKDQLDYKKEIWINPTALKDVENPSVVIPAANFIIAGGDSLMTALIRFLEQTDCPVTMAGLGAQAEMNQTPKELVGSLSETQVRAFKMLSERAVSIGVRGEFSAECLKAMGIKNVRVIGCPSFYFRPYEKFYEVKTPTLERSQVTITPGSIQNTHLLQKAMEWNSIWLMQMATELPELAFERDTWDDSFEEPINRAFHLMKEQEDGTLTRQIDLSAKQIWEYMKDSARIYFERDAWNKFYEEEKITFAYGSRFHGNMAAFRNGVPALWITHDRRTSELIQTLHLPHIDFNQFEALHSMEEMLDYCDYRDYNKHYGKLLKKYVKFLEENGLSHRF